MSDLLAASLLLLVTGLGVIAGLVAIGAHSLIGGYGILFWAVTYFAVSLAALLYLSMIIVENVHTISIPL